MISEPTRAARSSSQIQALRINRDRLLPDDYTPRELVPEPSSPSNETLMAFYEWAAFSDESIEARDAKRLMESMGVAR